MLVWVFYSNSFELRNFFLRNVNSDSVGCLRDNISVTFWSSSGKFCLGKEEALRKVLNTYLACRH
jgi:hypothetical protein